MGRPSTPLEASQDPWKRYGAQVRQLRNAERWTLRALAERSGFSEAHLSGVENGKRRPTEGLTAQLESVFGAQGVLGGLMAIVVDAKRETDLQDSRRTRSSHGGEVADQPVQVRPVPGDVSLFIADVTIPDGTLMRPQEEFVKTWRIENGGTVPWIERVLLRVGPAVTIGQVGTARSVPIPDTQPGEAVELSVSCRAMKVEGTSAAIFKMADKSGSYYFPDRYNIGLRLEITVVR